ncbi:hypothetical protein RRG08_015249 [Elysia crispata]|uniref:Uncharacterized protein n=1 Tax=Elysia crispata TaxID=231223 RepID=A0AAE0Z099_9GAST|nr:hypothetical protein RRG08_015249 [Elysia crispata]
MAKRTGAVGTCWHPLFGGSSPAYSRGTSEGRRILVGRTSNEKENQKGRSPLDQPWQALRASFKFSPLGSALAPFMDGRNEG